MERQPQALPESIDLFDAAKGDHQNLCSIPAKIREALLHLNQVLLARESGKVAQEDEEQGSSAKVTETHGTSSRQAHLKFRRFLTGSKHPIPPVRCA